MKLKKHHKIIFLIIILIIIGLIMAMTFLNNKANSNNNETKNKVKSLIGIWDIDGNTKYEFDEKGNGKLIVPLSEYEFNYTIKDNILFIDFKNENSIDTEYIYKIENNTLQITNNDDKALNYTLKKITD